MLVAPGPSSRQRLQRIRRLRGKAAAQSARHQRLCCLSRGQAQDRKPFWTWQVAGVMLTRHQDQLPAPGLTAGAGLGRYGPAVQGPSANLEASRLISMHTPLGRRRLCSARCVASPGDGSLFRLRAEPHQGTAITRELEFRTLSRACVRGVGLPLGDRAAASLGRPAR